MDLRPKGNLFCLSRSSRHETTPRANILTKYWVPLQCVVPIFSRPFIQKFETLKTTNKFGTDKQVINVVGSYWTLTRGETTDHGYSRQIKKIILYYLTKETQSGPQSSYVLFLGMGVSRRSDPPFLNILDVYKSLTVGSYAMRPYS